MKPFGRTGRPRRVIAAFLAFLLGLGPVATPAYAGLTALADEPLNVKNSSKPNIVLTIDDSTSMLFDFLPDSVIDRYCRDGMGSMNSICGVPGYSGDFSTYGLGKDITPGYIFQQYSYPFTTFASHDNTTPSVVNYDIAGPGSGCDTSMPKCSPGVDTGASPGIPVYPSTALYSDQINPNINSGTAYSAYGYWKLWPAPAHNNAFNHLYYNPMLTYAPPVHDDGTSFDSMDAGHTSNWTKVPIDPFAATIAYADLTANVTVGQWCNSDWSVGHEDDPAYCRTNGAGPTSTSAALATTDGDYLYPYVPSGINPFYNLGYKSDNINAATNKYTIGMSIAYSKVSSTDKSAINSSVWNLTNSGGSAKDSKYYFENDNVLWCDATATNWPHTGPSLTQTCTGEQSQTCVGFVGGTCTGGTQSCKGTAQTCKSNSQTCVNKTTTQTCQAPATQTCNGLTAQTCVGYQTQTCTNIAGQTCNGYQTQTCGLASQTCNGYKTQTCVQKSTCAKSGSVCTTSADCPDDSSNCTTSFDPPGCNTCVGPECGTCTLKTVCQKQACNTSGSCSVTGASCSGSCPDVSGTCSVTGASCTGTGAGNCTNAGHCSVNTGTVCTSNGDCSAINGACSKTGVACQPANAGTQCPATGNCSVNTGTSCTTNANCTAINGHCSIATGTSCTTANAGTNCPPLGNCSISGAQCKNDAACPNVGGTCDLTGKACSSGTCPKAGNCSIVTTTACDTNTDCAAVKKCSITGATCSVTADCPAQDLKCSIDGNSCSTSADCPTVTKTCTAGNVGALCTTNASCNVAGHCSIQTGTACTSNANCGTVAGACSISGAACTTDANCPGVPTASASAVCSDMLADASHTLRYDADHDGVVCRHNNQAYTDGTTAAPFNYPNSKYNTPVTAGTGSDACVATPRFKSVPRHYWVTNVEWCDAANASGPWTGYGDNSTGTCQSFKDTTHIYPRFYQFGAGPSDAGYTDNTSTPAFQRVDLVSGNSYTFTYKSVDWTNVAGPTEQGSDTVTRTYAQEMENYANWFAYYRTRIQAVKTVTSLSFLGTDPTTGKFNVDDQFRVGLHSLSSTKDGIATVFVPVDDFGSTQKTTWATKLFGMNINMAQDTPNLSAIERIGEYYKNGSSGELGSTVDPIVLSCQKNWHMLFTDGLTYQKDLPSVTPGADQDDTVTGGDYVTAAGLTSGANWPPPYREDPDNKIENSAADYATYYWVTDLRTSGSLSTNNVGTSAADKANWQHVNFAAISLGTEGKLSAGDQSGVEAQLSAGSVQWPTPYPSVTAPDASGVDDLWHASINSRGRFVNADNADEIKVGMGAILADIANTAGSRAGAGLQSINFTGDTAYSYVVTFEPGWGGTVAKTPISTSTLEASAPAAWQVGGGKDVTSPVDSLYAQLTPTTAKPTPWYSNRNIVTMHTNGTAIPFLFDQLSDQQQDALAPGKPDSGKRVLEYLRGSAQNEGSGTLNFRTRVSPLGDIVDASPVYVGAPNEPYKDSSDPGYSTFVAANKTRKAMIYVAANDGMLHAFDDDTGFERFAYIPRTVIRPAETSTTNPDPGIPALTLKEGALPPFKHHFYVDSTPKVVDVDFGGEDWHSILVGGLGKGGHAYYALDVTTPDGILNEADAASRVLWEFSDDDLGYTYGQPIITKTAAWSGKWIVVVPSGYNNASGVGKIWFLDAKTGEVLKTMSTGFGSSASPSGLAQIAGFKQDYQNELQDAIYGGDQYGNVWRFDVSDPNPDNWTVGLLAKLTAPDGSLQPVTTAPQIEIDIVNGKDRWVFVGTGRLLDQSDLDDPQIQSFYALRDGSETKPNPIVSGSPVVRSDLKLVTSAAGTGSVTAKGWVDDLPQYSQIVSPFAAVFSIAMYSGTKPQTDPCLTGQQADIYVRSFAEGVSQIDDTAATGDGLTCTAESCESSSGAVDLDFIITKNPDGSYSLSGGGTSAINGKLFRVPIKPLQFNYSHRLSWRILSE
jgi:type IV pilus assembly protein PilY1